MPRCISSERCRQGITGTRLVMWSYLACAPPAALASCAAARCVQKIATLVHRSLSGNAPGYLADDCQLVADARVRQLRSVDTRTLVVSRDAQQFWRQELRRDAAVGPQV